jgi:hypothetical protein
MNDWPVVKANDLDELYLKPGFNTLQITLLTITKKALMKILGV